jgi:porphobilinogen synthase
MQFPKLRLRRLRRVLNLRRMVRETSLSVNDLVMPYFVVHGKGIRESIGSMPGISRLSIDELVEDVEGTKQLGIPAVILFGIPKRKDEVASEAWSSEGIIQLAVMELKQKVKDIIVITDVCLCGYTSHGHCGVVKDGKILNDYTLELLAKVALSHVEAGSDMVAPSDMMDGRVGAIRKILDENEHTETPIMSYSAKYASSFYAPFREAAKCKPTFGDRGNYQMDIANSDEALREVKLDIEEGADIVMVKPALSYLDIIHRVKQTFHHPVAAYNVSGEFSLIKAAAERGFLDERSVVLEILTSMKRAGADLILTYFAKDVAKWLSE